MSTITTSNDGTEPAVPESRWEVGSEFHWDPAALLSGEPPADAPGWLPAPHALFATASGALCGLLRQLAPRGRLHAPSFFCMGVAEALAARVPVAWYRHLPDGNGPQFESLRAQPGDVVLAQNLFGRDARPPWDAWAAAHPAVTVVEDHTHDPFGGWAKASSAAYCVASLRKTLPIPDGALLWSPRGLDLPAPSYGESVGAELKLAAMILKAAWLGGRAGSKPAFRALQLAGERALLGSAASATSLTRAVLPLLDVRRLRSASTRNARELIAALPAQTDAWRVLGRVRADTAPFQVQLLCTSEATRDALLTHLRMSWIYAPVHWRQPRTQFWSGDDAAAECASRILTIPVDHRYEAADVRRVGDVLRRFGARPVGRPPVTAVA
jgi:hypothetical protein